MNGPLGSTWRRNTPVVDTIHIIPYLANILLIEPEQAYEPEVPVGARAGAYGASADDSNGLQYNRVVGASRSAG